MTFQRAARELQLKLYSKTQQNPQLSCHFVHHSCSFFDQKSIVSVYRNVFNTKVEETFAFNIVLAIQFEPKLTAVHHKRFA